MIDEETRQEIDKVVQKTLRDAGLTEPPVRVEDLLEHLELHRDFYDLEDPSILEQLKYKVRVGRVKLVHILGKIKLEALFFRDRNGMLVDSSLPDPKKEWASFHEAMHKILVWHRSFFLGDTAETLDPEYQEILEYEANYGASAAMFCGRVFTKEALDTIPQWSSIRDLKKRYRKSLVTTCWRYVQFSHDIPMAVMTSTPRWMAVAGNQGDGIRRFIPSGRFRKEFRPDARQLVFKEVNSNTRMRRGGLVGEFSFELPNRNGRRHEFVAQSFFNQHYIITFLVSVEHFESIVTVM